MTVQFGDYFYEGSENEQDDTCPKCGGDICDCPCYWARLERQQEKQVYEAEVRDIL
jgi:hypothetical protein